MSLDRTRETVRQKSVSPYDRYPDTAVALSQLTIKPRLRANQRESECETNESEAETLSAKRKRAWVAPQRVGILCNPTQMWFILHLNTQAVNALSSRKQSSTSTIRKPPTAQKKLSAAVRNTNRQRETQATADLLIHTWLCWHTTHNAIWRYILWPMPRSATTQGCFSCLSTFTADGHWWKLRLFNHLSQQAVRKWEREEESERDKGRKRGARLLLASAEMDCS